MVDYIWAQFIGGQENGKSHQVSGSVHIGCPDNWKFHEHQEIDYKVLINEGHKVAQELGCPILVYKFHGWKGNNPVYKFSHKEGEAK